MSVEPQKKETADWRQSLSGHNLAARTSSFSCFIQKLKENSQHLFEREILSPMDRMVWVRGACDSEPRKMLMLGSNNYLGLANHHRIKEAIRKALDEWGSGVAGPALLNGTTGLHRKLEERLSELKGHEDTCLFASGYQANLALAQALITPHDRVLYDEKSHASLISGLRLHRVRRQSEKPVRFRHNNLSDLTRRLAQVREQNISGDIYVFCESLYSMDGDMADLFALGKLRDQEGFLLVVDDAHGLGVLGQGKGGEAYFHTKADICMGTFSKAMAMTGGFLSGNRDVIRYLRFFGEAGVFSASLPVPTVAAVLEGLNIISEEPERLEKLHQNADYLRSGLKALGFKIKSGDSPIISILVPENVSVRDWNQRLHLSGIFVNSVEPPAVPAHSPRLRVSVSASLTTPDLKRCLEAFQETGEKSGVI